MPFTRSSIVNSEVRECYLMWLSVILGFAAAAVCKIS